MYCYRQLDTPSLRYCAGQTNSNMMLLLKGEHTNAWTQIYNTLDYAHGVGCIISCDQYIHDFSHLVSTAALKIHLTVKARGCSQIHTLRFTVYIQRSFKSISDRWLKWSSCLSVTTDWRSCWRKQMWMMCFSHAYTYCTWQRNITQVCVSEVNVNW